jgi:hypothetical protein
MAIEEDYQLTCHIEGDQDTFLVPLPRTALVDGLREAVYQRRQLAVLRVRAAEVNLRKVCPELHVIGRLSG